MNKEQKQFKRAIKKRRTRALRKIHPKPKLKWVEIKDSVIDKATKWLKK